jgi:toxin-antitoxin system PIN domain toxin
MASRVRALFDVNMLVALVQPDHVFHGRAHAWWDAANQKNGWASCPLTQNGFIRIVSQASYERPLPSSRAIEILAEYTETTDHAFWADDISLLDATLFDRKRVLGPKQLTDIYLLALAVRRGGRLVTFDQAIPISAVRGADQRHVVALR